ncbi:hypothetical protein [Nocardioides mangrovi]|uniref:GDYXXLXY domain-containing protein n=1 Tax=Nocardioides mangrovi TaxID=2874580 RepID=A0ABS7UD67_9ACTN|nr:hypothetical protein [Nocardioides mangrovi]MBZ5738770.1 hypothetical protein [Nocardioides mangrovi]
MKATARALIALSLGTGLALAPVSAEAQQRGVSDRRGDSTSHAVDITELVVRRTAHRITANVTIPRMRAGRLSGTELLIKPSNRHKVYAVTILRDRRGRVVDKSLTWRPLNDPIEPHVLPCSRIATSLRAHRTVVSVAADCLTKTRPRVRMRAKVRTVDGTTGLQGAYYDDQTRFTPLLRR